MDAMDIEAYNFVRQQIVRRLYFEANKLGQQPLSHVVIDQVVQYFSAGSPT